MIARLLGLALGLLPGLGPRWPGAAEGLHRARLELVGPLELVEVGLGRGVTRLALDLRTGESVQLVVPISERSLLDITAPEVRRVVPAEGRAAFLGWVPAAPEWEDLPAGLRARVRPPVAPRREALGWRALALLGGVALLVSGARRRPGVALAVGIAGGALALLFPGLESERASAPLRVLEGDAVTGRWLAVEAAYATLAVDPESVLSVETLPSDAVLDWGVARAGGARTWTASAPGAAIVSFTAPGHDERALGPERNGLADLSDAWVRGADGVWSARGPWRAGEALPGALPRGSDPPGWLASGLPQGVGVIVGRLARDAPGAGYSAGGPTWVRVTGVPGLDD